MTNCENQKKIKIENFTNYSLKKDTQILDTRNIEEFTKSHIPNSICVPLNINFPKFVNSVLSKEKKILIICEDKMEKSIYEILNILGFKEIIGILEGGFANWENSGFKTDFVRSVNSEFILKNFENGEYNLKKINSEKDSENNLKNENSEENNFKQENSKENNSKIISEKENKKINNFDFLIDIRNNEELKEGIINKSLMINMNDFINNENLLNKQDRYFISCRSGYRSVVLYGFLKNKGYDVRNVLNGYNGMVKLGLKIIKPFIK